MARQLKLWNGRSWCCHKHDDPTWAGIGPDGASIYAAAYSRADLRRLIAEYSERDPGETELRDYWNAGSWGNAMEGVSPDRGLWMIAERRTLPWYD